MEDHCCLGYEARKCWEINEIDVLCILVILVCKAVHRGRLCSVAMIRVQFRHAFMWQILQIIMCYSIELCIFNKLCTFLYAKIKRAVFLHERSIFFQNKSYGSFYQKLNTSSNLLHDRLTSWRESILQILNLFTRDFS